MRVRALPRLPRGRSPRPGRRSSTRGRARGDASSRASSVRATRLSTSAGVRRPTSLVSRRVSIVTTAACRTSRSESIRRIRQVGQSAWVRLHLADADDGNGRCVAQKTRSEPEVRELSRSRAGEMGSSCPAPPAGRLAEERRAVEVVQEALLQLATLKRPAHEKDGVVVVSSDELPAHIALERLRRGDVGRQPRASSQRMTTSRARTSPAVACPSSKLNQPARRIFTGHPRLSAVRVRARTQLGYLNPGVPPARSTPAGPESLPATEKKAAAST